MDEWDYNLQLRFSHIKPENKECLEQTQEKESIEQTQDNESIKQTQTIMTPKVEYDINDVKNKLSNTLQEEQTSLRFAKSPIHQWGVYTTTPIPKHTMIIEYKGETISNPLSDLRETQYSQNLSFQSSDYMFRISSGIVCDAMRFGNLARFINASCDPNCYTDIVEVGGEEHIVIFAKRDIGVGEELCYDYKFPIEEDERKWIKCRCGAGNCRGFMNVW